MGRAYQKTCLNPDTVGVATLPDLTMGRGLFFNFTKIRIDMDKRYQVFISSTYTDLIEERQQVMQILLQMDCIPTGMELFPAADEEQFEFIKKIIDDCDYYILIIGGRYGSVTKEGISFTEKEFDYAVERGIHIISFVHGDPDSIPVGKSEMYPDVRAKLDAFRGKVCQNRLTKEWKAAAELPGLVSLSLLKAIKTNPAIGWVRANTVSNTELLEQINELRKRKDELSKELESSPKRIPFEIKDLARGDEEIILKGTYKRYYGSSSVRKDWVAKLSWNQIIYFLGPHLLMHLHEESVNSQLAKSVLKTKDIVADDSCFEYRVEDEIFQTVKVQLIAFGWINVQPLTTTVKSIALFWILTESGRTQMLRTRSIKTRDGEVIPRTGLLSTTK